jgi:radical SAM-linked protein
MLCVGMQRPDPAMPPTRFRIRFAKQADLRLIGHHDLVTAMERLFRRIGLVLAMSQGFHPRPKMSFPLALALGIAGTDEVFELELVESPDPADLLAQLRAAAPPGLEFLSAEVLERQAGKARVESVLYELPLPPARRESVEARAADLMRQAAFPIRRDGRNEPIDLKTTLFDLAVDADVLRMRMRVVNQAAARPQDVIEALGLADLVDEGCFLTRTEVRLAPSFETLEQTV